MHVEAVSEGERVDHDGGIDEESAQDSDTKQGEGVDQDPGTDPPNEEHKVDDVVVSPQEPETPVAAESTPTRSKRRSRSRTRSRGSRDMKNRAAAKQSPHVSSANHTNDSSADEYYTSAPGEDPPPSPPLVSPIPSHFLPASHLLATPFFYPGTTPPTPLPTLHDLQRGMAGMGLYRSNSAGAARAMAMRKLTGGTEPFDFPFISPSPTPPPGGARLMRNNTVSGGERTAARMMLFNRLGNRIRADGDQTSGGEEVLPPVLPPKRRRRRSKRNSSRASTVVDDREEREPASTTPTTPVVPPSPLPFSSSSASRAGNGHATRASPTIKSNGNIPYDYEKPMGHRGVVVEDEDEVPERELPHQLPLPHPPSTPARGLGQTSSSRLPHSSDAPSSTSTDSAPGSAVGVPVFLSRKTQYGKDIFPASPFATPLKEKPYPDDDEQVLYQEMRSKSRLAFERMSEISWVAEPVPERMPLNDDDEDEDEDDDDDEGELEPDVEPEADEGEGEGNHAEMSDHRSNRSNDHASPRPGPRQDLVVDIETSPEPTPAHMTPSPISPIIPLTSSASDALASSQISSTTYPTRLSVATPSQLDRSPSSADFPVWDDPRATVTDSTIKRTESTSRWERMKSAMGISRSASVNGRRSRTNSIRDPHNTDSSISRESRASISKEKGEQPNHDTQAPSASASILSLPITPAIGPHSPIPPASHNDFSVYGLDSKLFPFPGIKELEAQRNRANRIAQSASNPDVTSPNGLGVEATPSSGSSNSTTRVPESGRERKLSHQASDSRLLPKFNVGSPPVSSAPSSASHADYFSIPPSSSPPTSAGGAPKLPMNREAVKKWLIAKKFLPTPPALTPNLPSPPADGRTRIGDKKPSLSELLLGRKEIELGSDWEDLSHEKSRTPASPSNNTTLGNNRKADTRPTEVHMETQVIASHDSKPETIQPLKGLLQLDARQNGVTSPSLFSTSYPSPPDPPSSTTPDPQSSLDEFPTRSTSVSYSDMSSSHHSPDPAYQEPSQGVVVLERLEEVLGRGSKSSLWPNVVDDPPRKLVLSSPVLQVANANTVKDRFLFLFNDILVIAKPIVQDHDNLLDPLKPSPLDRKFIVKSVCHLRELKFSGDRDESRTKALNTSGTTRHPVVRHFVQSFSKDPDNAVIVLFGKANIRDDPVALGQLLFRTLDLDRARLGEYLARRTSKVVLKAYIAGFGLAGLRIDKALRVFLQSINIPSKAVGQPLPMEYLLDSFASRWYEANAGIVTYDKDLAIRLVRAIAQLNDVMHGGIAQEPGITGYPKRNVVSRDFVEAFRRYDTRCSVTDDLLDKIYAAIRRERLSQARNPANNGRPDIPITIKRPLPSRLTYRQQSDPIVLRIPQPDPDLTIQLFGQDIIFDPPTLNFTRSSEASFRVTGTSLGAKSIIMWRSGPNGLLYSGLPLSNALTVERAFMRNTFQVAFLNHDGSKRKYMFSVDDPLIRHQWSVQLKRQIEIASSSMSSAEVSGPSPVVRKANEALALKVLQETLIDSEGDESSVPLSPVDQALARLTGSGSIVMGTPPRRRPNGSSPHVRSKSRSQMYHQHGAGQFEPDLSTTSTDMRSDEEQSQPEVSGRPQQQHLWSGRDLEIVCRQNSLITPMLAYLQVDRRDRDIANGAVS
ncbi:uncharacterized protein FIBRA_07212 [Fibroporia radiculosa]|uniref:SEC7 domain-containing protein n=1 Tax=Fibroporia radiculosa TaxID=599839 RepID=J4GDU1_9APHY|nr:uncharacterized protein FIBRA_07212 [Fibroporia radiculosa]CCM05013.1 predicted protein [Fibroporia radiculosa]